MQIPKLPSNQTDRIKLAIGGAVIIVLLLALAFRGDKQPDLIIPPAETPKEKAAPPSPPNIDNSEIMLDLLRPTDEQLEDRLDIDTQNEEIEQTFAASFVLLKCQIISQDDYRNIFRALVQYALESKLEPDLAQADATVRELADSAKASYSLLYQRTQCDEDQLLPLAKEVTEWSNLILTPRR